VALSDLFSLFVSVRRSPKVCICATAAVNPIAGDVMLGVVDATIESSLASE